MSILVPAAKLLLALALLVLVVGSVGLAIREWLLAWRFAARLRALPSDAELARRAATLLHRGAWNGGEHPGMVLSGGGGKGAYEIGCIEALRDAGVSSFSRIAGTSVGALNGALLAQGDLAAARQIWTSISHAKVLRFLGLGRVLLRLPLLPFYGLRHAGALGRFVPPSLWESASVWWRARSLPSASRERLVKDLRPVLTQALEALSKLVLATLGWWLLLVVAPQTPVAQEPRLPVAGEPQLARVSELIAFGWRAAFVASGVSIAVVLLWFWFVRRDRQLAQTRPIASNDPLRQMLAQHLQPEKILEGPTTYATVASLRLVEQPPAPPPATPAPEQDEPEEPVEQPATGGTLHRWWRRHVGSAADFTPRSPAHGRLRAPRGRGWPSGFITYLPEYTKLQSMSSSEMAQRILDSAALPEVFHRRVFDGDEWVDGGVADNTPLLPLLADGVERAVVVYLDRRQAAADTPDRIRGLERALSRARRLGEAPAAPAATWPAARVSLLRIVPSVSLGSMLSGTLNFSSRRSRQLLRLGYADTIEALEAGPVEWVV